MAKTTQFSVHVCFLFVVDFCLSVFALERHVQPRNQQWDVLCMLAWARGNLEHTQLLVLFLKSFWYTLLCSELPWSLPSLFSRTRASICCLRYYSWPPRAYASPSPTGRRLPSSRLHRKAGVAHCSAADQSSPRVHVHYSKNTPPLVTGNSAQNWLTPSTKAKSFI